MVEEEATIVGTAQSSVGHGGHHSRLVDGKGLGGSYNSGGCAHTSNQPSIQWFSLELDAPKTVTKVQIAARSDCCAYQGKNVKISIGASREYDASEPLCRPVIPLLDQGGLVDYPCTEDPKPGKYIKLSNAGHYFVICEVKVFVRATTTTASTTTSIKTTTSTGLIKLKIVSLFLRQSSPLLSAF